MSKTFKYDIALSLSDKDSIIADQLYDALKSYSINLAVYYYNKENQLGRDLKKVSFKTYMHDSRHVVILASKNYVGGEWAGFEWKLARLEESNRPYRFIIPIRLDDYPIEGLSNDIVYETWRDNARELADRIKQLVDEDYDKSQRYFADKEKKPLPTPLGPDESANIEKAVVTDSSKESVIAHPENVVSQIKKRGANRIYQLLTGLLVTVLGALIVNWMQNGNMEPPPPDDGPQSKETVDLILSRSEKYADKFIYVDDKKVGVFRNYSETISDLTIGNVVKVGTDTNKEFVIKISQNHLKNETIEHDIF